MEDQASCSSIITRDGSKDSLLPPLMLVNRRHSSPSVFPEFRQDAIGSKDDSDSCRNITISNNSSYSDSPKPRTLSVCHGASSPVNSTSGFMPTSPTSLSPRAFVHHHSSTLTSAVEQQHQKGAIPPPPTHIIRLTSPPKNRLEMKKSRSSSVSTTLKTPFVKKPALSLKSSTKKSDDSCQSFKPGKEGPPSAGLSLTSGCENKISTSANRLTNNNGRATSLLSPNDTNYMSKIFKFEPHRNSSKTNNNNSTISNSSSSYSGDDEIALINDTGGPSTGAFSPLHQKASEFQRSPSPRSPLKTPPTPGVVITSFRLSQKRSSITSAAIAFAAATAGATISPAVSPKSGFKFR